MAGHQVIIPIKISSSRYPYGGLFSMYSCYYPMEEDTAKLHYWMGYLNYKREKRLILKPQGMLMVEAHIDAAFSSHQDS